MIFPAKRQLVIFEKLQFLLNVFLETFVFWPFILRSQIINNVVIAVVIKTN